MTLIEFIGFIISLAAMVFLVAKRFWDESQRRRNPEKYAEKERQKQKIINDFMRSLNINEKDAKKRLKEEFDVDIDDDEMELEKLHSKPPLLPNPSNHQNLSKKRLKTAFNEDRYASDNGKSILKNSMRDSYREEIVSNHFLKDEAMAYDVSKKHFENSHASVILNSLPSRKNMVVIKEIFGPPKSMQINPWD